MGCMGCGNNGGSSKTSNHSPKKQPNWGMTKQPGTSSTQAARAAAGGFGTPKVKLSFRGKK